MPYLESVDGTRACRFAYHNRAMAAIWLALATGDAGVSAAFSTDSQPGQSDTTWLTCLRYHEDIIWSGLDESVPAFVLDYCTAFYAGEGDSLARAARFHVCADTALNTMGMLASLIGGDGSEAVARYRLLLGAACFAGHIDA